MLRSSIAILFWRRKIHGWTSEHLRATNQSSCQPLYSPQFFGTWRHKGRLALWELRGHQAKTRLGHTAHGEGVMFDLDRWPLFNLLPDEFLGSVRIACVFGSSANEAVAVTRDDEVYALGSNGSSCLGVGDSQSCLHPRKIETLCKKRVVSLAFGSGPHVLALTGWKIMATIYWSWPSSI